MAKEKKPAQGAQAFWLEQLAKGTFDSIKEGKRVYPTKSIVDIDGEQVWTADYAFEQSLAVMALVDKALTLAKCACALGAIAVVVVAVLLLM